MDGKFLMTLEYSKSKRVQCVLLT